jgi:hypothetical protein
MGDGGTVYGGGGENAPFIGTNWFDANGFVCKLNKATGRTYRLLTDAEWEFAARGGNKSKDTLYSGSDDPDEVAWTSINSVSADEMTMIGQDGTPYRAKKQSLADAGVAAPNVPAPSSTLEQLIAAVERDEPERIVTAEQLANPDENERDTRLLPGAGKTWFMDGRCCGGNHKYRYHLEANGDAEFVVMDYDNTHKENILAKGKWFTSGNIALHLKYEGKYYNYLYTVGTRIQSFSEYMPAGPIYNHISFQEYERGDFRIFSNYDDTDAVHRPQTMPNPVYPPSEYQPISTCE